MASIKHRYDAYNKDFDEVARYTVNYKEVFSLSYLYMLIHEWLCEQGWASRTDEDFKEILYLQKEKPAGREIWARWRLTKNPLIGSKQNFWRYDLDIDIHVLTLKEVELVVNNKKLKADKGEVEVNVVANVVRDFEGKWSKNPLMSAMGAFFGNNFKKFFFLRFMQKTNKMMKKQLYNEAYDLQESIKHYLKLETYLEATKGKEFWAKRTIVD